LLPSDSDPDSSFYDINFKEAQYAVSTIESFVRILKKEAQSQSKVIEILKESENLVKSRHPGWEQKRGNFFSFYNLKLLILLN
jgi:hypothetical protein